MKNTLKIQIFGKSLLLAITLVSICESGIAQVRKEKTTGRGETLPVAKQPVNTDLPKVTQIDLIALKNLLKREGENPKPLLINFWATWCEPCKAEFPDLVAIDADYREKIDFITISLDELSEIDRDVPKFLAEMKATMPAYLLKTGNEEEAIAAVYKEWGGGLPFTILFNGKGEIAYSRQGIIKQAVVRAELEKVIAGNNSAQISQQQIVNLPVFANTRYSFEKGKADAQKDVAVGKLIFKRYGLTAGIAPSVLRKLKEKYKVEISESGCLITNGFVDYVKGYNEISTAEMKRKFGNEPLKLLAQ